METERSGATVLSVARQHGTGASMLFRWRVQFDFAQQKRAKLAPVAVTDGQIAAPSTPAVLLDLLQPPDGMKADMAAVVEHREQAGCSLFPLRWTLSFGECAATAELVSSEPRAA